MPAGRPKKKIDYKLVEDLANIFCTQEEIAGILGVHRSTLFRDKEFCNVYKKGREGAKQSLRRKQYKLAETNASMAIFLGKNYLDQRDQKEENVQLNWDADAIVNAIKELDTKTD